jgi:hypothetical protein
MNRFNVLLLSTLCLGLASGCDNSESDAPHTRVTPQDLQGEWTSAVCESMPNADGSTTYFQRHFTMTETDWTLHFNAFGDPGCSVKLFTARVEGAYTLVKDSGKVAGATEANFGFGRHSMTAYAQPIADWFQGSQCGTKPWKLGEEQETSGTGCVFFKPVAACGTDHDVVKVEGKQLFFGQRPADNDMCTEDKRPTALTQVAVVRD